MNIKVSFNNQIHLIRLTDVIHIQPLLEIVRRQFRKLPNHFQLKIDSIYGQTLDTQLLQQIHDKKIPKVKLYIVELQPENQLFEIKSQSSFIRLSEDPNTTSQELKQCQILENGKIRQESMFIQYFEREVDLEENVKKYELESMQKELSILQFDELSIAQNIQKLQLSEEIGNDQEKKSSIETFSLKTKIQYEAIIKKNESQIILDNVQCDRCFAFPIQGKIYKCMVCPNFELCSACEAKYHHFHPTLVISKPEHYPKSIKIFFSEEAEQYMKRQLQLEQIRIKEQKQEKFRLPNQNQVEIDPSTLKSTNVRSPNFLEATLGSRYRV